MVGWLFLLRQIRKSSSVLCHSYFPLGKSEINVCVVWLRDEFYEIILLLLNNLSDCLIYVDENFFK